MDDEKFKQPPFNNNNVPKLSPFIPKSDNMELISSDESYFNSSGDGNMNSPSNSPQDKQKFIEACNSNNLLQLKRLLKTYKNGANIKDERGNTLLHLCCWNGNEAMCELLLNCQANPLITNEEGSTPLHWICFKGHENLMNVLLLSSYLEDPNQLSSFVNLQTKLGETALHIASERGYENLVKLLLNAGAKPDIKNSQSWTPIQKAKTKTIEKILKGEISSISSNINQNNNNAIQNKKPKVQSLDPATSLSKKFFESGFLDFNETLIDGFYDAGRSTFDLLENLENLNQSREVILLDKTRDPRLRDVITRAQEFLKPFGDLDTKIRLLAMFVSNQMGGSQLDDICDENEIAKLCFNVCKTVKNALNKNIVPLGCVTHGLCRHRSLLYKYLCDQLDIPCRLVRGTFQDEGHSWNIVYLANQYYIVDIMHDPTQLYPEDSPEANNYKRVRRIDSSLRQVGGVGGSSLRLPLGIESISRAVPLKDFKRCEIVIYEKIGSGGFGSVHRCSLSGFCCAIKIMHFDDTAEDKELILQEIRILETCSHPNIVAYLGHDIKENEIHLFMEYFPSSVDKLIRENLLNNTELDPQTILMIGTSVVKGLHYLHSKSPPIVHRDIKSSNVLIAFEDSTSKSKIKRVVLCDFGVSKLLRDTLPRTLVGTLGFIAPEIKGETVYNEKADIWSFGCFLYEIIAQKKPKGPPFIIPESRKNSLKPIIDIMNSCFEQNPNLRPNSISLVYRITTCILP